jgi:hypothetical protein
MSLNGWLQGPSTYKDSEPVPPRYPKTHKMAYDELVSHVLDLEETIRELRQEADSVRSDLFSRRRLAIAAGETVPDGASLSGLPNWRDQQRSETIAAENAEADAETRRQLPGLFNRT